MMDKILKDRKVRILIVCVLLSLFLISVIGITTGLDLQGGSKIIIQTERPLSTGEMGKVVEIMTKRLNGVGLKDIRIRPWGDEFILIEIAGAEPEEAERLIGKPGKLDVKISNISVFTGADLKRVDPFRKNPRRGSWEVPFTISKEAAERFRDVALETNFSEVSMYMDEGTGIMIVNDIDFTGAIGLSVSKGVLLNKEPLSDAIAKGLISIEFGTDEELKDAINQQLGLMADVGNIKVRGRVVGEYIKFEETFEELGNDKLEEIKTFLTEKGVVEENIIIGRTGLVNNAPIGESLREELLTGRVVEGLVLETGGDENARLEAEEVEVVLSSGALPIKVDIRGKYGVPPELGEKFARNAITAGIFALLAVATFIFLRYKTPKIAIPIMLTGVSEVIIILGVASLIKWNIDLPAIAGIIAAVGTGVDDQIIITGEILTEKEKSIRYRIKNAFFIIMAAWFTTVAAMVPLMLLGFGLLVGFAITTIIGVTAGVFITRPAYAQIIQYLTE